MSEPRAFAIGVLFPRSFQEKYDTTDCFVITADGVVRIDADGDVQKSSVPLRAIESHHRNAFKNLTS